MPSTTGYSSRNGQYGRQRVPASNPIEEVPERPTFGRRTTPSREEIRAMVERDSQIARGGNRRSGLHVPREHQVPVVDEEDYVEEPVYREPVRHSRRQQSQPPRVNYDEDLNLAMRLQEQEEAEYARLYARQQQETDYARLQANRHERYYREERSAPVANPPLAESYAVSGDSGSLAIYKSRIASHLGSFMLCLFTLMLGMLIGQAYENAHRGYRVRGLNTLAPYVPKVSFFSPDIALIVSFVFFVYGAGCLYRKNRIP